jgi:hypothetical protein
MAQKAWKIHYNIFTFRLLLSIWTMYILLCFVFANNIFNTVGASSPTVIPSKTIYISICWSLVPTCKKDNSETNFHYLR